MNAPVASSRYAASHAVDMSSGELAGILPGTPINLRHYKAVLPDRWAAFLKAHFRNSVTVAFFFDVDERTARNWMEGITAPRAEVVLALAERAPSVIPLLLSEAA